jgi:ribosomal subunit interface protein
MHLIMRIDDIDLAEALKTYIERRLRFSLGRFGNRVGQISIRIKGNGPAGSRCRISTEVVPFGHVAVEETSHDLFAAIDAATGRIGRLFGRELERAREARLGRESIRLAA